MSEIKFACPHCSQHIACDGDYAELPIECPSCGGTMVVPRLTATPSAHPAMVVVASTTSSPPRQSQTIPTLDFWSERKWDEHSRETTGTEPNMGSFVFVSLFATLALAFVMMLRGFSVGSIVGCLVLGGMITGFLLAKRNGESPAKGIVSGVVFAVVLVVATPVLALGILFMGCTVCAR